MAIDVHASTDPVYVSYTDEGGPLHLSNLQSSGSTLHGHQQKSFAKCETGNEKNANGSASASNVPRQLSSPVMVLLQTEVGPKQG
jgi:hypothetical protein